MTTAYGQFKLSKTYEGKRTGTGAHRVMWTLCNGPVPIGLSVLHRCDNPPCVNPAHLFLGTVLDNTRDMIAKGRDGFKGVRNGRAVLNPRKVAEIKDLYSRCRISHRKLGARYGVSECAIWMVLHDKTWRQNV